MAVVTGSIPVRPTNLTGELAMRDDLEEDEEDDLGFDNY